MEEEGALLIESGQTLEQSWFWGASHWVVPAVRIYRHIQSLCPLGDCYTGASLANLEFQSLCAKPQSHSAQVWRLLLPCWANLLFSSPPPCLPLCPQAPESIYSWTPAVTSPPASCCCLPLPVAHSPMRSSIRPHC